ncbi:MAG: hypothetical protein GX801_07825 [Fibrobacter sp.]|nr:hypothetical protein [Fibrobacter sp.]
MSFLKEISSYQNVWQQIENAFSQGKFPQALLLEGPAGVGKKFFAIKIAQLLGCTQADKPCGQCFHCKMWLDPGGVDGWILPLVIDAADRERENRIAEASEKILAELLANPYKLDSISPVGTIYVSQIRFLWKRLALKTENRRVIVIPHAHAMNENAANALLKNLEEVPPNTHFILTTSQRSSLLPTIISRCIPLKVPSLEPAEITTILKNYGYEAPSTDLQGFAMGSAGKAMQYTAESLAEYLRLALDILELLAQQNYSQLFRKVDAQVGRDAELALHSLEAMGVILQELLRLRANVAPLLPEFSQFIAQSALFKQMPPKLIYGLQEKLGESNKLLQERKNPSSVLQNFALCGVKYI